MKQKVLILLLASALAAALVALWRERRPPVPGRCGDLAALLERTAQRPALASAALGFCLLDAGGNVMFEHHAETSMIPASSLKTLTTATALEMLGPDFRFETRLRATAPLADGEIAGDLVIEGGADPMLALADLNAWAAELKSRGLRRVVGRVIGDGRLFPGTIYDDFWDWGDIGNGYGSGVSGLNLEHNRYTAVFDAASSEGLPASFLGAHPGVPGVRWNNEVLTGSPTSGDGVVIHGGERTGLIHLRGTVPLGAREFTVTGAVPDPGGFAAFHLREALVAAGIQVDGAASSMAGLPPGGPLPEALGEPLHVHRSPPLIDIITSIHATSDNHETECVFRLLGRRGGKAPVAIVRDHWRSRGLEFEGLRMEDGCGLARADFIRPLDLARLQYLAGHGPHGAAYRNSLLSTPDGKVRWKGGAMSGVRTTTGFVVGDSGEEFCFAFMVNHYTDAAEVGDLRDALIAAIRRL